MDDLLKVDGENPIGNDPMVSFRGVSFHPKTVKIHVVYLSGDEVAQGNFYNEATIMVVIRWLSRILGIPWPRINLYREENLVTPLERHDFLIEESDRHKIQTMILRLVIITEFVSDLSDNLCRAVRMNNLTLTEDLLSKNADPDAINNKVFLTSPLQFAVTNQYHDIITTLCDAKADVNIQSEAGTLLQIASRIVINADIVKILCDSDANVNLSNDLGMTPLFLACGSQQYHTVNILCGAKADVNKRTNRGETPISKAIQLATFKQDSDGEADGTHQDEEPESESISTAIVNLLVQSRADLQNTEPPPLCVAAEVGNREIVSYLLASEAKINSENKKYLNPLFLAALAGNYPIVKTLLDSEANPIKRKRDRKLPQWAEDQIKNYGTNKNLHSPLIVAAAYGDMSATISLCGKKANPNQKSRNGTTPVFAAVSNGHAEVVQFLCEMKADCNTQRTRVSPIFIASCYGYQNIAQSLCEARASVNSASFISTKFGKWYNDDWRYPLWICATMGHLQILNILLEAGADMNIDPKVTPLMAATHAGHEEIQRALVGRRGEIATNSSQRTICVVL